MSNLDSVLSDCYRLAVVQHNLAGAIALMKSSMDADETLISEARARFSLAQNLSKKVGGDLERRCFFTSIHSNIIREALAGVSP